MGPWGDAWILIWIVVLVGMVWLIVGSPSESTPREDALAILRARFARGEIDQEEFERARASLLMDKEHRR